MFDLVFYVFVDFDHQKIFATAVIFVVPVSPKCRISSSLLRRSSRSTIRSSRNTSPHFIESLSNTCLHPSGLVFLSFRLILALTLVSSGSIAVLEVRLFSPSMKSKSVFFFVSSVIFLLSNTFPTMWLI